MYFLEIVHFDFLIKIKQIYIQNHHIDTNG